MTEKECLSLVREDVFPVILGNGATALRLFLRLRLIYGLAPLILSYRRGLAGTLLPGAFVPLVEGDPRLLCEQLSDFSDRYEDSLLLLISTDKTRFSLSDAERETLESSYILCDDEELFRRLSPLLFKKSQRKATDS